MAEPFWITTADAILIHDRQLIEHGGLPGLRDHGLLESATSRPRNQYAYGHPELADLAAAYAFGIARNHPFVDGNKRTSFGVCVVFLDLNGHDLPQNDAVNVATWLALAAGSMTESDLAVWLRMRIIPMR